MKAVIFFLFLNVLFSLGTLLVVMIIVSEMRKGGGSAGHERRGKAAVYARLIGDGVGRMLSKVAPIATLPL